MKSIRWRIGLSVFAMVATLHVAISAYVLERFWDTELREVDDDLAADLLALSRLGDDAERAMYVRAETVHDSKWDEEFFQIHDAAGARVVASANVPIEGLGPALGSEELDARRRGAALPRVQVWERPHPNSRKGHVRLRVAEASIDGARVVVANTLKARQKAYWQLREQLVWGLGAVAILVAAAAWWVTRRSLLPIHAIIERARELGAAPAGSLPRSGSGDELDRLAEVLNGMLGRIRAEVQRVRRLSADAAHALRTPLAAVRGTLEVHVQGRRPEEVRDLLPALEVLDETTGLVNRLLLLERLQSSGPDPARMRDLRLDVLAREVVDGLALVAHDRKIELECRAQPARVHGDPGQLREALFNLLDNALRHTPEGGRVEVAVETSPREAMLVVEDSGPGLRPDQLERVFERFYSEQPGGRGSGLGLSIARAIAESHGGTLRASSPRGARFELRLSRAETRAGARGRDSR
jgi:signal transduction histidine kinase